MSSSLVGSSRFGGKFRAMLSRLASPPARKAQDYPRLIDFTVHPRFVVQKSHQVTENNNLHSRYAPSRIFVHLSPRLLLPRRRQLLRFGFLLGDPQPSLRNCGPAVSRRCV